MLQLVKIEKQYPNQVLFSDANLTVSLGERIGLVGPNGTGKTTLLRIIAGLEPIDSGDVVLVKGTTIGYLRQDVTEDPHDSILEEVLSARPEVGRLERDLHRMAEVISLHPQDRKRLRGCRSGEGHHDRIFAPGRDRRPARFHSGRGSFRPTRSGEIGTGPSQPCGTDESLSSGADGPAGMSFW